MGFFCLFLANSSPGEIAQADTPVALPNGTRFVVPRGWDFRTEGSAVVVTAPEGDSHVAVVDGGTESADAAVAAAWAIYRPGFTATTPGTKVSPREGWDEMYVYRYDAPAGEPRTVTAAALLKGKRWTVRIRDVTDAVAGRREGQMEVLFNTLYPDGYRRESFAGRTAHRLDASRIAKLTQFIEDARRDFAIPGVALGLIQDGKMVFEGGFGVRELGRPEPVDGHTLFNVASNSKALTTLMLGKLVEQGRFGWDTPVMSLWPEFRLGDAATTKRVQVKHLICACTGMPRRDREWIFEGDNSTPAAAMRLLFSTQPTSDFGDTFQYSNLMAAAAGFFGGHVAYPQRELGAAYDAVMQRLVFDPLGMRETTFDFDRGLAGNHSAGHDLDVDGVMRVASQGINRAGIATRPSGNLWSNAHDLLRYVRMELAKGKLPDGRRYIREDMLLARRAVQATEGRDEYYAMGLKIDRQWGVDIIRHGGIMIGYTSDMVWLPEHGVGAVILVNSGNGALLRSMFRRRLLEVLFDGDDVAARSMSQGLQSMRSQIAERRRELDVPADPAAVMQLAGLYRSAELGVLKVQRRGEATWFDFGGWKSEVATLRADRNGTTFVTISPGEDGYEFTVAEKNGERQLISRDDQHEYVFNEEK